MRCQFCDGGKIDWPTLIEGQTHAIRIDCPECGGTGEVTVVDTAGWARFADCPECGWL